MNLYSLNDMGLSKYGTETYFTLYSKDDSKLTASTTSASAAGTKFFLLNATPNNATNAARLLTVSSEYLPNELFTFEASFAGGTNAANVALWDFTTNAIVAGTSLSTASTTIVTLRSGSFYIVPGHAYGITYWAVGGSNYFADAYLVKL